MGSFYVNVTIDCPEPAAFISELKKAGAKAFVAPKAGRYTVIALDNNQVTDPDNLKGFVEYFSERSECLVFGVMLYDDDILYYELGKGGKSLDRYNSSPGYFTGDTIPPSGGDAGKLGVAFGRPGHVAALSKILGAYEDSLKPAADYPYLSEQDRHRALVRELGLPETAVEFGYAYVVQGELPAGLVATSLIRVN